MKGVTKSDMLIDKLIFLKMALSMDFGLHVVHQFLHQRHYLIHL